MPRCQPSGRGDHVFRGKVKNNFGVYDDRGPRRIGDLNDGHRHDLHDSRLVYSVR